MDIKRVNNLMVEKLNKLRANNIGMDIDILCERIKNQDWPIIYIKKHSWLVGCFGFNGPLRQYFSLYRAVSQREGERGEKG